MAKTLAGLILTPIALLAPLTTHASVVISEIAWMGTSASANAEWIELQNTDSTAVNLSGWTLMSSTGAPSISLTGTIGGSGYYLLERTSDTSVPGISADQLYSGALSNGGSTLTLKDAGGTAVDTVIGGTDWKNIGGDNVTKQTPQRTGDSWVSAVATPRSATVGVTETPPTDTSAASTTTTTDPLIPQTSIQGTPLTYTAPVHIPKLYIQAGPGRVVAVGASVPFSARVYDETSALRNDANVMWSFGDGVGGSGRDTEHTFSVPGTYLVVLHAYTGVSDASTAITVEAVAPLVRIAGADASGVTLEHSGQGILDLSSWKLVASNATFTFPLFSAMLPAQRITLSSGVTGISSEGPIQLLFPDGRVASTLEGASSTPPLEEAPIVSVQPSQPLGGIQEVEAIPPPAIHNDTSIHAEEIVAPSATETPAVLGASVGLAIPPLLKSPWTASFFGLLLAAGATLVLL